MKLHISNYLVLISTAILLFSCNGNKDNSVKNETIIKDSMLTYKNDSTSMNGFVAYDAATDKKRPVVLVVHEWWGLNDYAKSRARQLAALGYLAMAVDMYGDGKTADNPEAAGAMAMPFYLHPDMAKNRFMAALDMIKTWPQADTTQIAAIGYCFGGAQVLNMARMGVGLKGVVSFHGNLAGVPVDKNLFKSQVLVCHGDSDKFVLPGEVAHFKKEMDSLSLPYTFKSYPGASHAFSNPNSTATGKKFSLPIAYNAAADTASWNDMKAFFGKLFH